MAFIIPDKVLDALICTFCHKYLSVKPITVYPNRDVECGRCVLTHGQEKRRLIGVESLYGKIAKTCVFKCINRFDGCRELLTYSQVLDHEKVCLETIQKCPICYEEMMSFLMLRHFHSNHKDAILDCPAFVFNLDHHLEMPSTYIYQEDDNLFFLYISYSKSENRIKLELVYMGSDKLASNICHQFTVTSQPKKKKRINKKFDITCNSKPSCANEISLVDASNMSHFINVKFKLFYKNVQFFAIPENVHSSSIKNSLESPNQSLAENGNASSSSTNNSLEESDVETIKFIYRSSLNYTTEVIEFHSDYNPQCYNCEASCIFSLSDSYAPEYYYSPTHDDFLCFCCFQWLTHENKIKENHLYFKESIPSTLRSRFCKWDCGKDFTFSEIVSHEIFCKNSKRYYNNCPYYETCGVENISALALTDHVKTHFASVKVYPDCFKLLKPPFSCLVILQDRVISFNLTTSNKASMECKIKTTITYGDKIQSEWKPHVLFFYDNKFTPLAKLPLTDTPSLCTAKIILVKDE